MELSDVQLGDLPGWLGLIALVLALVIFARDQGDRTRAQVDGLGIWATASYSREDPEVATGNKNVDIVAHLRNAGNLPLRIVQIAWRAESTWLAKDLDQPRGGGISVWIPTKGTRPELIFQEKIILPPQETMDLQFTIDVSSHAPPDAHQLTPIDGIAVQAEWLLVLDSAGRKWQLKPGQAGRALRVRPWWRPKAYMPRKW
jgi:hypothetical protein